MGKGEDTTDPSRNVGPGIAAAVRMMKLADEFQLKSTASNRLAPDIHNAATVTGQDKLTLQPFVLDTLVEDAG